MVLSHSVPPQPTNNVPRIHVLCEETGSIVEKLLEKWTLNLGCLNPSYQPIKTPTETNCLLYIMLLLTPLYSTPRGCIQATTFFWMDSSSPVCTFILPLETVTAEIQSKLGRCSVAALETSNQIAFYFYSYVYLYILIYFYLYKCTYSIPSLMT